MKALALIGAAWAAAAVAIGIVAGKSIARGMGDEPEEGE